MGPEIVWQFGSRSGSLAALVFFSVVFGLLGYAVSHLSRRHGGSTLSATVVGVVTAFGLMGLTYLSSVNGFYEVRGYATHAELRSLLPFGSTRVAWSDVEAIDVQLAFRNRWRVIVRTADGQRWASARGPRSEQDAAAAGLRARKLAAR